MLDHIFLGAQCAVPHVHLAVASASVWLLLPGGGKAPVTNTRRMFPATPRYCCFKMTRNIQTMYSCFIWRRKSLGGITTVFVQHPVILEYMMYIMRDECLPLTEHQSFAVYRHNSALLILPLCFLVNVWRVPSSAVCVFLLPRCPDGPRPSTVRPCQLPCKKDCIMTPFSDWTPCPVTCDAGRVRKRSSNTAS